MMLRHCLGVFVLAGLLACGSSSNDVTTTGTDANALGTSPGGAATLALVDLESIRPDDANLAPAAAAQGSPGVPGLAQPAQVVVGCRAFNTVLDATNRTTTVTYTNCAAANGWSLNGTIVFTSLLTHPGSYTSVFNLRSQDTSGTKTWAYTGTKNVTINFVQQTATIAVPTGTFMTVAYQETQDTSKSKTFQYAPNLTANWATVGQFKLMGSYTFQQVGGPMVTATVAADTPLIWTPACCYPTSGAISLNSGAATITAVFGPDCGGLKLGGTSLPLTCQ